MALKVEALFDKFSPLIKTHGPDLVKKVGNVYHFEISKAKGDTPTVWTIDLKNGSGSVTKGKNGTANATFSLVDDDAIALFSGTLKPQTAFMQGKMKIKGNMQAAMKFTPDLFPKDAKL
jgi:putative sterol carrier protein